MQLTSHIIPGMTETGRMNGILSLFTSFFFVVFLNSMPIPNYEFFEFFFFCLNEQAPVQKVSFFLCKFQGALAIFFLPLRIFLSKKNLVPNVFRVRLQWKCVHLLKPIHHCQLAKKSEAKRGFLGVI
jgi:hypothetical protein